jgi:hypothetical protein
MYPTPRAALEAGLPPAYGTLHLDHIQAIALGGHPDGPAQLTHAICNLRAGGKIGAYVINRRRRPRKYNRW